MQTGLVMLSCAGIASTLVPLGAQTKSNVPAPTLTLPANVVARFGDTQIPLEDIQSALDSIDPKQKAALRRAPEQLQRTISSMIAQRVVLKEALARRWDQQPAMVAELGRVREAAITQSFLNSVSKPPPDFPSAADLQRVYDANKNSMLVPRQYRMAQIFIACAPDADAGTTAVARIKLDSVTNNLGGAGSDFSAIARAESDDKQSAAHGGDIGWIDEAQIQPEIRRQLPDLKKGSMSAAVRLRDGWHFIKVADVQEAYTPSLKQVRDELTQQMRALKAQALTQAYVANLLKENPVTINPAAVTSLVQQEMR